MLTNFLILSLFCLSGLNSEVQVVNVKYENTVTLTCSSRGPWFNGTGAAISNSDKYSIVDNQLTIKDLRRSDIDSDYACGEGDKKESFSLRSNPELYVPPVLSVTITDGGSVDYECRLVVGCKADQSLEWSWYKEETKLSKSQRFSFSDLTNSTCNSTLSIKSASMLDAGSYTCVATNSLGSTNTTFTLRVKDTLAALWPFLGIVVQVAVLCVIILVFEKKCGKKPEEEDGEQTQTLMAQKEKNNSDVKKRSTKA